MDKLEKAADYFGVPKKKSRDAQYNTKAIYTGSSLKKGDSKMLPIEERDQVNYPKQIMKITELMGIGFPKEYLMNAYRSRNQTFAWKMDITKKNSPILFDTEGLEAYRQKQISVERQANKKIRLVI